MKNPSKDLNAVISKLPGSNILDDNQMICVKGGDGTPDPIILPPNPPKKEQ